MHNFKPIDGAIRTNILLMEIKSEGMPEGGGLGGHPRPYKYADVDSRTWTESFVKVHKHEKDIYSKLYRFALQILSSSNS